VPIAFGADSVASALHLRLGATPRGPGQTIMTLRAGRQKAELLILHKTGTSHFALTCDEFALTRESCRNRLIATVCGLPRKNQQCQ
jgi:hypothetical protein